MCDGKGAKHTGCRPGRQQPSMDTAHM
ncbi:MAG: phage DNA packaging protein J, partial [Alphaproteobacteria bacterium]|nr:phage DNA packaging protein J [Alphaproteobacteria bacterium]